MQKISSVLFLSVPFLITSCGSDDDGDTFIPLEITTQQDIVQVSTLQTVAIDIFSNDTNVPKTGVLSITNTSWRRPCK
jgi:hypothetical protein